MIDCQRPNVQLPPDQHYLNLAYMAPLHSKVIAAGEMAFRRQATPWSLGVDAMFAEVDDLRTLFARLTGIRESSRVALMPSASYGLATAANNLVPRAGQNIIVVGDQFPSNYYAWSRSCRDASAELRIVSAVKAKSGIPSRSAEWNQRLLEAIDSQTRVVAIPNVHWSDGTLFDLKAVRTRTNEVGAALVIDGTQSVGAVPIDVGALKPDALICAGYKTLLCPYGTAFGYFGPRFDDGKPIEETWVGRDNSSDFANLVNYQETYQPHALRYEAGGRSNFITMPMVRAALELLLEWTPAAISDYCRELTKSLPERLRAQGFWIEDTCHRSPQLFGIRVPDSQDVTQLFQVLEERNIAVSLRGDALRVSPHLYNTAADIDALVEALAV